MVRVKDNFIQRPIDTLAGTISRLIKSLRHLTKLPQKEAFPVKVTRMKPFLVLPLFVFYFFSLSESGFNERRHFSSILADDDLANFLVYGDLLGRFHEMHVNLYLICKLLTADYW